MSSPDVSGGVVAGRVMGVVGGACIVLGGLVAAVTDPLGLTQGSWVAAYLVLVGGVAQVAMGWARTWQRVDPQPRFWAPGQVAAWNLGNVVVIGGTLTGVPVLVDLGSLLLVIALAIALHAVRGRRLAAGGSGEAMWRLVPWAYRGLLVVLTISLPVGMVLSHVRHG